MIGIVAGLLVAGIGVGIAFGFGMLRTGADTADIGPEAAKAKVETALRDVLGVPEDVELSVADAVVERGLYRVNVTVQGQEYPMYISLDGAKLFPQGLDTEPVKTAGPEETKSMSEAPKSERPDVRLFVMSYCPYGTQMEKGILPVLETLGDSIDFTLEFVDYAMHGKKEIDENLRQYCIRTEEPSKLPAYLACFLRKGEGTESACLRAAGVDTAKNETCMKSTDETLGISKDFADESTYQGSFPTFSVDKTDNETYGVQGSPTLVINGTAVPSGRDAASILTTVCSAFETVPAGCEAVLSSDTPSPGFGDGATAAASDASCGS